MLNELNTPPQKPNVREIKIRFDAPGSSHDNPYPEVPAVISLPHLEIATLEDDGEMMYSNHDFCILINRLCVPALQELDLLISTRFAQKSPEAARVADGGFCLGVGFLGYEPRVQRSWSVDWTYLYKHPMGDRPLLLLRMNTDTKASSLLSVLEDTRKFGADWVKQPLPKPYRSDSLQVPPNSTSTQRVLLYDAAWNWKIELEKKGSEAPVVPSDVLHRI
ncbi:hypothetical protein C8J56DRAFT_1046675 [Mycena floridula]|nr:hypothetical protein C8J56DRAFT_1046675 [Mycena floridula]